MNLATLRTVIGSGCLLAAVTAPFAETYGASDPVRPVPYFSLETCRSRYSNDDLEAMGQVTEVAAARGRYPASYLFVPSDGRPHPGVIWLHGSEGGRWSEQSMCKMRYLASKGFAAFFFCYSDCGTEDPPEALSKIDLKRTYEAMTWLKHSPYVDGRRIALTGVSRGAEQTVVLATYLAKLSRTNRSIELPDAIIAHAPFGRIVSTFNWRWSFNPSPGEWRWHDAIGNHLDCLRDDEQGIYPYKDANGDEHRLSWSFDRAECANKPALNPHECWRVDAEGPYTDDDGTRLAWQYDLCSLPAWNPAGATFPAWTWGGSLEGLEPWTTDIPLEAFAGSILISQGTADAIWHFPDAAGYLMARLQAHDIGFVETRYPHLDELPSPLPTAGAGRILFATFEGEGHGFSRPAAIAERSLFLTFLQQRLGTN